MRLSYEVEGQHLIESAFIPFNPSSINLITGVENQSFGLIGGIIAKLFPIQSVDELPCLQSIIRIYTGQLKMQNGELPKTATYVGIDPDRHLLFSTVKEERNGPQKLDSALGEIFCG